MNTDPIEQARQELHEAEETARAAAHEVDQARSRLLRLERSGAKDVINKDVIGQDMAAPSVTARSTDAPLVEKSLVEKSLAGKSLAGKTEKTDAAGA